jgi:ATP-dependent helicase HrpB
VLGQEGRAVLQAPPGAGKTTLVPLAILRSGWLTGRCIVLEPRRIAARAAAARMADLLDEPLGRTVGVTTGEERRVSAATRIEVVTEGVLVRRLQQDPTAEGIGAVVLDEFHERAIPADLALALTAEVRAAIRPDLRLLVMSATLDAAPIAALLDGATVVTSQGRTFDVETVHRSLVVFSPQSRPRRWTSTTATCWPSCPVLARSATPRGRCRAAGPRSCPCTGRCHPHGSGRH